MFCIMQQQRIRYQYTRMYKAACNFKEKQAKAAIGKHTHTDHTFNQCLTIGENQKSAQGEMPHL